MWVGAHVSTHMHVHAQNNWGVRSQWMVKRGRAESLPSASGCLSPYDDQVHSNFPRRMYHIPVNGHMAEGCHGNKRPEILTLTSNRPVKQPN